jgi:hypothetical protein
MTNDPYYIDRLYLVGSAALVRAWLDGDWDAVEGAYFDAWSSQMILPPFAVPADWPRFRSFDWGFAKPFSVGWWAIASGDPVETPGGGVVRLPRGAILRYREWYGCQPGKANEGLRLEMEEIADGILKMEGGENILYGVADPAIFDTSRGPSIAERSARYRPAWAPGTTPVIWRRGENKRIPGWSEVRKRMRPQGEGSPMSYVFSTCRDSIRLMPIMQHDKVKPEDLDTDAEDHCFVAGTVVDGAGPIERVGVMTRPFADVVTVSFSDGRSVTCTRDHRFLTTTGWIRAIDLLDEWSYDCAWSPSLLGRFKSSAACAITGVAAIFSAVAKGSIAWCGWRTTAPSLKECTSTTSTATRATTASQTSPSWLRQITSAPMRVAALLRSVRRPDERRQSGTPLTLVGRGTRNTGTRTSSHPWRLELRPPAKSAAGPISSWLRAGLKVNIALGLAGLARCVSVEEAGKADVFCLSMEEGHFTIEGGIVVSNCADEWRYAHMSRPMPAFKPEPKKWKNPLTMDNMAPIVVPKNQTVSILDG